MIWTPFLHKVYKMAFEVKRVRPGSGCIYRRRARAKAYLRRRPWRNCQWKAASRPILARHYPNSKRVDKLDLGLFF